MSKADLSPLAKVYLEHLQHIMAGYDALGADIPAVLRDVAARAEAEGVEANDKRLKRVWSVRGGMKLVLRLRWDKDQPLPELSLNSQSSDQPEHARVVFGRGFFDLQDLPSVQEEQLRRDAFEECCRVWDASVERCEELLESPEWLVRTAGVALMPRLGRAVAERLIEIGVPAKQANEVKKLKPNGSWPIHCLWKDLRESDGQKIQWCVTFNPSYGRMDRSEAPFLGLVAYPGKETNEPLAGLVEASWQYEGCAVLVDASSLLQSALDGASDQEDLDSTFVARASAQYLAAKPLLLT